MSATEGWSTPSIAEVAATIRATTGLIFPDARRQEVETAIRRVMSRHDLRREEDLLPLIQILSGPRDELIGEITVGETYFFREPGQIEELRTQIIPDLLTRKGPSGKVRIWSAGCASGEEPYTLAMIFDQLGVLNRADIHGTDVARDRLDQARRGRYSEWSLRVLDEPFRQKYFQREGRFFTLDGRLKEVVSFGYLNLVDDSFLPLARGLDGMDLVLCRNVLIYFDAPSIVTAARRLMDALADGGWLVLGSADPPIGELVECESFPTPAGTFYRKRQAVGAGSTAVGIRPVLPPDPPPSRVPPTDRTNSNVVGGEVSGGTVSTGGPQRPRPGEPLPRAAADAASRDRFETGVSEALRAAYSERDFAGVVQQCRRLHRPLQAEWVAWVRSLANLGSLEEAREVADRAVKAVGPITELLYLQAVLALQADLLPEAERKARQALYVDPGFVVAHLTLAEVYRRLNKNDLAVQALRKATTALLRMPPQSTVPGSDGESAGRLLELASLKMRLLDGGTAAGPARKKRA